MVSFWSPWSIRLAFRLTIRDLPAHLVEQQALPDVDREAVARSTSSVAPCYGAPTGATGAAPIPCRAPFVLR
jgi:hypothetical protein